MQHVTIKCFPGRTETQKKLCIPEASWKDEVWDKEIKTFCSKNLDIPVNNKNKKYIHLLNSIICFISFNASFCFSTGNFSKVVIIE